MSPHTFRLKWLICCVLAAAASLAATLPPPVWQAALEHISAESLRGHLSFIASDRLEGRATPSRGLDIAAEYIAAQFRRAGLEPAGDDGYFQTADMLEIEQGSAGVELKLEGASQTLTAAEGTVMPRSAREAEVTRLAVLKAPADASGLKREQVEGKAVVLPVGRGVFRAVRAIEALGPAAIVTLAGGAREQGPEPRSQLVDARERPAPVPRVTVSDPEIVKALGALKPGPTDWKLSLRIPAPRETPVKVRNVIGVLRGSDAALKDTYVLLTAHYDHLGLASSGEDRIYNGANDDGSGTVSVIEIASALATLPQHPKRSIVFMTLFGEERGLLGSQYYVRHPVFPLRQTVGGINLEQLGRTDSTSGPEVSNATFTGFDFSDLPETFEKAGRMTGVKVYRAQNGGDEYFARSDNESFADRGIPSHTVVVAFNYPDYHAVGDEWPKIDYQNMAKVDRMLALGLLMVADSAQAPRWNPADPLTKRFAEAAGRP